MKAFYQLLIKLPKALNDDDKINCVLDYFEHENSSDKLFGVDLLLGKYAAQKVSIKKIKEWALEWLQMPEWLLDECYKVSGDMAETIALLHTKEQKKKTQFLSALSEVYHNNILSDEIELKAYFHQKWMISDETALLVWIKFLTGSLKSIIAQPILKLALAKHTGLNALEIEQKLNVPFDGLKTDFEKHFFYFDAKLNKEKPYPFKPYKEFNLDLNSIALYSKYGILYEWKGTRCQMLKRDNKLSFWSEDNVLLNPLFSFFETLKEVLSNGTVIEGKIIVLKDKKPTQVNFWQEYNSKNKYLKNNLEKYEFIFMAYDICEFKGKDIRFTSYNSRREMLNKICNKANQDVLTLVPFFEIKNKNELEKHLIKSREFYYDGLLFSHLKENIGEGIIDVFLNWKKPPNLIKTILVYATKGNTKHLGMFTDYTFAIKNEGQLVPISKAINGLSENDIEELDEYITKNTIEKFGPVRSVRPNLLFEIAFEAVLQSKRHKSGYILKNPTIFKWLKNENSLSVDHLKTLAQFADE